MNKKVELTLNQLKTIFLAGMEFEKQNMEFDMDEIDEITALDFDDFIKDEFNIEIQD